MYGTIFFRYKSGSSFLHKMQAVLKLCLMLFLSIFSFYLNSFIALVIYLAAILFSAFYLRFTFKEILTDNLPSIFYAFMLYLICVISNLIFWIKGDFQTLQNSQILNLQNDFFKKVIFVFTPDKKFFPMSIHLSLSVEICSIFYRTTSQVQFSQAFSSIEHFLTKKDKTPVADTLSLTISFIPRIAKLWNQIDFAWKARGGNKNVRRISKLTPILFKTAMNDAYKKSLAKLNRE